MVEVFQKILEGAVRRMDEVVHADAEGGDADDDAVDDEANDVGDDVEIAEDREEDGGKENPENNGDPDDGDDGADQVTHTVNDASKTLKAPVSEAQHAPRLASLPHRHNLGDWFTPTPSGAPSPPSSQISSPHGKPAISSGTPRISQTTGTYVGREFISRHAADVLGALGGTKSGSSTQPQPVTSEA